MTSQLPWSPAPSGDKSLRILSCADPSYFKHVAVVAVWLAEINRTSYLVVVADSGTAPGSQLLAAAPDHFGQNQPEALTVPDRYIYVNAGVLLLDLDSWGRQDLSRRLLKYIEQRNAALELHHQDAINAVRYGASRVVDRRWNVPTAMFRAVHRCFPEEFEPIREACWWLAIIHYTGSEKLWLFRSRTIRKKDCKTAWREAQPPWATTMQRIEYWVDRLLSKAGCGGSQVLQQIGRAPAKQGIFAAALTRRTLGGRPAIVGQAGSAWGTGR